MTAVPDPGNGFAYWGDELTGTTNPVRLPVTRANAAILDQTKMNVRFHVAAPRLNRPFAFAASNAAASHEVSGAR